MWDKAKSYGLYNVPVPIYFTVQPGGAKIVESYKKARLIYPNYQNHVLGTHMNFWHYEPEGQGWEVYGQGSVVALADATETSQTQPNTRMSRLGILRSVVRLPRMPSSILDARMMGPDCTTIGRAITTPACSGLLPKT